MTSRLFNQYVEFEQLYNYWKQADEKEIPFKALLLCTQSSSLEKRLINFVYDNLDELNNMSGNSCWIFTPIPKNVRAALFPKSQEISYSIGNLLSITPDQFPCLVFFDNLIHSKKILCFPLKTIFSSENLEDEFVEFFRFLFSLTNQLSNHPQDERTLELNKSLNKRFIAEKDKNIDIFKFVNVTLSLTEIAKNIVQIFSRES